jgi:hypothetical protein
MKQETVTMHVAVSNDFTSKFPLINFRKKRLTVAITAQFDMECAQDAVAVKQMIDGALMQLEKEGHAKITYSVSDV